MSDVEFNHGDIAWVKLGYCWWPGEVVAFDQLPESIQEDLQNSSKTKLPLAIVKFFQEDTYEYVKKSDKIYPYNCERKDEFIRKGLEMHRAKKVSMDKFPDDVATAEKRSGGDEAIVNDPKYSTPQAGKKIGLYTEIFGSAKIKNSTPKPRGKPPQKASLLKQPSYYVTHPRFTGLKNDHQRKILLQQPIKQHDDSKENKYKCNKCDFMCTRLNVIALHDRTHNKNDPYFKDKRKKKRMRRPKIKHNIPTSTTNSIDEDLALLEQGLLLSEATLTDLESTVPPAALPEKKGKKKRKRASAPQQLGEVLSNKKPAPNIRNDLLAEWDDADDNDDDADETDMEKSVDGEEQSSMETSALLASPAPKQDAGEGKEVNALLEVTKVPELPALPSNASGGKTPEVATKLTNPKKRFVKSFEDFELSLKEREKEELEKKQDTSDKKMLSGDDDSSNDEPIEERRTRRSIAKVDDEKQIVANESQPSELRKSTRRSAAPSLAKDNELSSSDEKKDADKKMPPKKEEAKKPAPKKVDEKKAEKLEEPDSDDSKSGSKKDLKQKESKKDIKEGKESPDDSKALAKDVKDVKALLDTDKKKAEKEKEKPKPKEPILTEIDVFGSLRAQENEKYKKKSEDSPRRETRASRSKSRSESSHDKDKKDDKESKKAPAKVAQKEDTDDEPPINNGSEKDNVPLISKIKSKLMNVLANEGKDTKSAKSRRRAHESDLAKDDKDSMTKKSKLEESEPEPEDKVELEPDTVRRHSLRTSASVKPNEVEKKIPTKAEVKSPAPMPASKLLSPGGRSGPKTYLRATRATNASPTPSAKAETQKEAKKSSDSGANESDEEVTNDTEIQNEQANNKKVEKVEDADKSLSPTSAKRRQQQVKKSSDATESANLSESSENISEDERISPALQSKREIVKKSRDSRIQNIDKKESPTTDTPVDSVQKSTSEQEPSLKKDDTTLAETQPELKEPSTEALETNEPKATLKSDAPLSPPERRRALPRASRLKNAEKEQNLLLERKKSTDKIDTAVKTTVETKAESAIETKPAPSSPTKSKQVLARSPSPVKSPGRLRSPASQEKEKDEIPKSPAKLQMPLRSPPANLLKSPSPQSRLKSPSPVKTVSPLKSPPLILNKDAPKIESPKKSLPNKGAIESGSVSPAVIKSPQKVSLNSQELSIEKTVDKFEVTFNNKGTSDSMETDELEKILEKGQGVATNKDKDISTVTVAKDVLAKGQIEFAKDEEEASEQIATTIPTVEDKLPDIVTAEDEQVEKRVVKLIGNTTDSAAATTKTDPIILNSRMTSEQESTSKLLEVLMGSKTTSTTTPTATQQQVALPKVANPKFEVDTKKQAIVTTTPKGGRILTTAGASASKSKPTILSNTIIKRADTVVAVKKTSQTYDDIENIDTFIIKKPAAEEEQKKSKTKILEHTIITPGGQLLSQPVGKPKKIIQQEVNLPGSSTKTVEEKVYDLLKNSDEDTFDINNMPIVLSDQPLLAEGESVVVGQALKKVTPQQQQLKTTPKQTTVLQGNRQATPATTKTFTRVVKGQRVYQTGSSTLLKQNPTIVSQSGKPGQYVIVPSASTSPAGSKYTVGKRQQQQQVVKKQIITTTKPAVQSSPEASGNKIMIVTNPQGQRSRVVLTPEQASRMGYQTQTPTKKIIKTTPSMLGKDRKVVTTPTAAVSSPANIKKQTKVEAVKQQPVKKFSLQGTLPPMKAGPGQTRTVIIKDQQGNIVNRIHGFSDEDIEKQINEQLEAINRAANVKVKSTTVKRVIRKVPTTDGAATPTKPANVVVQKTPVARSTTATNVPPLAPISPVRKVESTPQKQLVRQKVVSTTPSVQKTTPAASATIVQPTVAATVSKEKPKEERQPKQMVIQDSLGNETTITEGQILALPSETVDGQPQSYMLVTLDESGNLTPLNNEALMSLDPNLNLGGDLSNMVLQIEGGNSSDAAALTVSDSPVKPAAPTPTVATPTVTAPANVADNAKIASLGTVQTTATSPAIQPENEIAAALQDEVPEQMQAVACSINKGDVQQQLIITGDPVAAQKFLESLRDGNPEIAQLLAQAEGNNIFIHTDGQQILINTDADSQIQVLNPDGEAFAAQTAATKNQDILAAALADTDVFQAEAKVTAAQLSPGYPLAANNVLETSTVNSPIMTPLEVPSAPTKRANKSDVLNQLPSGVDLPITVTDPHIAQTVSNQQVSMIGSDLSTSIDLSLSMQDVAASSAASSTEMSSPNSFAYSLAASLDDAEKFSSPISMPLLTEDPDPEVPAPTPSTSSSSSSPKVMGEAKSDVSATTSASESTTMSGKEPREYMLANDIMSNRLMSSLSVPPLPDIFEAYDNAEVDTPPTTVSETMSTSASSSPTGSKRTLEETPDILSGGDDTDTKRAKLD